MLVELRPCAMKKRHKLAVLSALALDHKVLRWHPKVEDKSLARDRDLFKHNVVREECPKDVANPILELRLRLGLRSPPVLAQLYLRRLTVQ